MQPFWYRHFPRATYLARKIDRASYEPEMELLGVLCAPDKTGIDIGAKVGMYTYRIRKHSRDVVAFEPIPLFHSYLHKVFGTRRARIEPYAVSNKRANVTLRMPYDSGGGPQFGRSTIDPANKLAHKVVATVQELEIETRTVDDYAFDAVGFIKIDVEGHELAVLEGARKTIERDHPNLLIECNDDHFPDAVASVQKWMKDAGYDLYFLEKRAIRPAAEYSREPHWTKQSIENFICIHSSRAGLIDQLRACAETANLRPRAL